MEEYVKSSSIQRGIEARIALSMCKESGRIYGVRMEKSENGWSSTWAFPIDINKAKREGYDSTILKGMIGKSRKYNGCPFCGKKDFVVCGTCHKLNCKIIKGDEFTCDWCGNTGKIMDYAGDGVLSGGDLV